MRTCFFALLTAAAALAQEVNEIRLEPLITGLTTPIDIQSPRDGSGRLFVVQQNGIIRLWRNGQLSPFLDIASRTRGNGECGLLGMAFPPGFATKRHFYVNYTNPQCNSSVVARYTLATDNTADPASERVILRVTQPFTNHKGGQLQFGPDGYLYIGFGDGGSGGDPLDNGQNRQSLLGKLLRIDVESGADTYTVPTDNPFGNEVWAYGLRNPWRFSFDKQTRDLWIGDVGQDRAEEIDFYPANAGGGRNFGWRIMEGFRCRTGTCDSTGTFLPVHEYTRAEGDTSVTGGYVYRGPVASTLTGTYVYADYSSGRIWGIDANFQNRLLLQTGIRISSFGEDEDGTLYLADHSGRVLRIVPLPLDQAPPLLVSVVNGASFLPGLAPGAASTAFVRGVLTNEGITAASALPLPNTIDGVQVLVNGIRVPVYAVAKMNGVEQVNFQFPSETSPGRATITVRSGTASVDLGGVVIRATQAEFFTNNGLALGVHAADNTLVTAERPLVAGEYAYFYATGLGATRNAPASGEPASLTALSPTTITPTVTLAGRPCEVFFAGLAPGFVGVYQVNIRVPVGVSVVTGNPFFISSPDLVISQGSQVSKPVPVPVR